MTVAVVDRAGRPLAVFRKAAADPANDDIAVGLARTAAFFSHNQAPLSSRTVRFISGVHFPPGIRNTPSGALYGIENTNRGCDFNVTFNEGRCIPRATSFSSEGPCNAFDQTGCGPGIVTGKYDNPYAPAADEIIDEPEDHNPARVKGNPGGLPLYRAAGGDPILRPLGISMIGGIGVAGVTPGEAEYAAFQAARSAGFTIEFPPDAVVFIDGIRLPFIDPRTWPDDPAAGNAEGTFVLEPHDGGCAADRYLVGPLDGKLLSRAEVEQIVAQSVEAANRTRAAIRLPLSSPTRMVIAVADADGTILAIYRMRDSTVFSIDVAVAKARNVAYFSTHSSTDLPGVPDGTAVTNRTIGFGSQPLFPSGIDRSRKQGGPFFDLFKRDLANPCSQGSQPANGNQNGVVFFAGSTPLYRDGSLVGGLGISGDGIEQDDYVSANGAAGFLPERSIRADRIRIRKARLPFFKFPRQPEGVTHEELMIGAEELN